MKKIIFYGVIIIMAIITVIIFINVIQLIRYVPKG